MNTAKLAFLTSPSNGRYVLNIQKDGSDDLEQIEISQAHLGHIIADGAHHAYRQQYQNRVHETQTESANDGATGR